MLSEDTKILEFNQYQKLMDLKIFLKIHLQQKQVNILHQVFQYLQYCHLKTENNHNAYRGKGCMKKYYCEFLKEHRLEILILKRKK